MLNYSSIGIRTLRVAVNKYNSIFWFTLSVFTVSEKHFFPRIIALHNFKPIARFVWVIIFRDILNRRIKQVKNPIQSNARGAAFIASVGLGYINWEDIPNKIEIANIYDPNPENREIYDELFKEFKTIYKITKSLYRRLNK